MPKEGLEPSIRCRKRILSPPRIPFRHSGLGERRLATPLASRLLVDQRSKPGAGALLLQFPHLLQ